jgi:hypothetical protein
VDLRDCAIREADGVDILADHGFFIGNFTVYPEHPLANFSPFLVDRGDGIMVSFKGTARDYLCDLDDIRTLYNYHMGEFHFKRGWTIVAAEGARRPLARVMNELFALRDGSEPKSYIVKRVMNGIIGRLLEIREDNAGDVLEYGDNFDPISHALITTPTRLQVFDFIARHELIRGELVHVGVDGLRATCRLASADKAPMGGWRCTGSEPAFVLSPGGIVSPDRNFKRTGYADLLEECQKRPRATHLGRNASDPIDIGRLFLTQTRGYTEMPAKARDLLTRVYHSETISLDKGLDRGDFL